MVQLEQAPTAEVVEEALCLPPGSVSSMPESHIVNYTQP